MRFASGTRIAARSKRATTTSHSTTRRPASRQRTRRRARRTPFTQIEAVSDEQRITRALLVVLFWRARSESPARVRRPGPYGAPRCAEARLAILGLDGWPNFATCGSLPLSSPKFDSTAVNAALFHVTRRRRAMRTWRLRAQMRTSPAPSEAISVDGASTAARLEKISSATRRRVTFYASTRCFPYEYCPQLTDSPGLPVLTVPSVTNTARTARLTRSGAGTSAICRQ